MQEVPNLTLQTFFLWFGNKLFCTKNAAVIFLFEVIFILEGVIILEVFSDFVIKFNFDI